MPLINNISEVPRARASVSVLKTDNGENPENPGGGKFEKHADEMHMMA